jgi:hypothetical protein
MEFADQPASYIREYGRRRFKEPPIVILKFFFRAQPESLTDKISDDSF